MADIRLQDVVKIYGVSKNQKKHRQLFFKKEKTLPTKRAVDDVTLTIPHGSFTVLVGPSGCGKTTLLKSISARLTPQQGEIHYENRSLYAMSEADRRRLLRTEYCARRLALRQRGGQ